MNITVYGAGYVGLVSAVCFAKLGHDVVCMDIQASRIALLNSGQCPIYEDELPALLTEQRHSERLQFTTDISSAVGHADIHIIATGTPSLADGSADLSQLYAVIDDILQFGDKSSVLVIKSTVPVGTGDKIDDYIQTQLLSVQKSHRIGVTSNPEFLREGTAVHDFMHADRIILGGDSPDLEPLKRLYQPLVEHGIPLFCMNRTSSELTKYAANALLATKISFMNFISQMAEQVGANVDDIRQGVGADFRIGPHFLQAGIGFGGSCFPKDVRALEKTAEQLGVNTALLKSIETINSTQKQWVFQQLQQHFDGVLQGRKIGIWGLAFKPGTDDMREASSLVAISALLDAGATVYVYDPAAMNTAKTHFSNDSGIHWCTSQSSVLEIGLDALVIITEWEDFKQISLGDLAQKLQGAPLVDGRNCFSLQEIRQANIHYYSIGRPVVRMTKDTMHGH